MIPNLQPVHFNYTGYYNEDGIPFTVSNINLVPTLKLRWLHDDGEKLLQQMYVDFHGGTYWINIEETSRE